MNIRSTAVRLLLAVPLLVAGLALVAPNPAAAFACTTSTNGGGTIKGSVVVPAGAVCGLGGVTVGGGITVQPGARLHVRDAEIRGAIVATQPVSFSVLNSTVCGDVVLTDNHSNIVPLATSVVRESVTIARNSVSFGVGISVNTIDGDLDCFDNNPAPDAAFPNIVGGEATGQCAGLVAP